jgi:hypothetical protein
MSKISLFMLGSIIIAIIPGICLVDYLIPLKKTNRFYAASIYEKIFENFTYFLCEKFVIVLIKMLRQYKIVKQSF